MSNFLHLQISAVGLEIRNAAEIGVYSFESSTLRHFFGTSTTCHLYEPVPVFCDAIQEKIRIYSNVELRRYALADRDGSLSLCLAGPSTFDSSQDAAPAINRDGYQRESSRILTVPCFDFFDKDPGDYDLVTIDTEGSEYSILSRMRSRPLVISIETQSRSYVNPKLQEIKAWMHSNQYRVWAWDDTDTIFIKHSRLPIGLKNDLKAWYHNKKFFGGEL